MPEHRTTKMRKYRRMKFLCIISGCPTGARKWHISYFCHAKVQFTRNYTQTTKQGLLTTNKG